MTKVTKLHPIYNALAGVGVVLNTTAAIFNGYAAAITGSGSLAFMCAVHVFFSVGLILFYPWGQE